MTKTPNLSVQQVAQWLGVDARTVYRLAQRRKIPCFKVGNQWRFNRQLLKAWIVEQASVTPLDRRSDSHRKE